MNGIDVRAGMVARHFGCLWPCNVTNPFSVARGHAPGMDVRVWVRIIRVIHLLQERWTGSQDAFAKDDLCVCRASQTVGSDAALMPESWMPL